MELLTDQIKNYVVSTRRTLHAMPELSCEEHKTSAFIASALGALGLKYRAVHTGLYADIAGADKSRTVAFRCDMDGLPIKENNDLPFRSAENMHACGHDGHMTIVLTLARLLAAKKPDCNVRLIFQFGEEGEGGADKMIKAGVTEGVDEIYAFHLCPELDKGKIASCEGAMFAGTVEFDVDVKGRSAHCADREKGADAVMSLRRVLESYPSLNRKFERNTLLHIGRVDAGAARNVVANSARMYCTLRYFDVSHSEAVMMNLSRVLTGADNEYGTDSSVTVNAVYPPLINSAYALSRLKKVVGVLPCEPRYTAEDFAFYTQVVPGCMAWLGVRDERYCSPLHSDTFGFDEAALFPGIEAMFRLVCSGDN